MARSPRLEPHPMEKLMHKSTLGILIGGLLPALLFGVSQLFQKTSMRAGIGIGPYLMIIGLVVVLAGGAIAVLQQDATLNPTSAGHAATYGLLWAAGIACIAIALGRYDAKISQLVPLYNMNTLVAVVSGLVLLSEWKGVAPGRLLLAAVLTMAGGLLAAMSTR